MSRLKHTLEYLALRAFLFPFEFLPLRAIHIIGSALGSVTYALIPSYRKRSLSNLSLATKLNLSEKELKRVARESFQNLMITVLEFGKFSRIKSTEKYMTCVNPEPAHSISKKGQGIIFFCAHQANWETLFLDGNQRMPGTAIGRPIKNPIIYDWIVSIRERFGGKMITPRNAIKEGLRALKQGRFLGVVGDQGMPESGFYSDFLGRGAWTSPIPAMLAYKTKSPLIGATLWREKGHYYIRYSSPLHANPERPMDEEVPRLMTAVLEDLEKSILKRPGQWLWQHNRWKQETPKKVYYKYRHESILIIVKNPIDLTPFRELYPKAFITILAPKDLQITPLDAEVLRYQDKPLIRDYRFKLVFDFTKEPDVKPFYKGLSAFEVVPLNESDFEQFLNREVARAR